MSLVLKSYPVFVLKMRSCKTLCLHQKRDGSKRQIRVRSVQRYTLCGLNNTLLFSLRYCETISLLSDENRRVDY